MEEVQAGLRGGIALGDGAEGVTFFAQGHGSGQGVAFASDVRGRDLTTLGVEEEEGEGIFTGDADRGFLAGGGRAPGGFRAEIEGVTVVGRGLGVVQDGLIAEGHAEDLTQDLSALASRKSKRDVEG